MSRKRWVLALIAVVIVVLGGVAWAGAGWVWRQLLVLHGVH